jgi:uncharacterized protein YxeA
MKEVLITLLNLLFLLLLFFTSGFALKKNQDDWFRVYIDEVEYYRFKNSEDRYIELTTDALNELAYDDLFWDAYTLKAIVLKDEDLIKNVE